MTEAELPLRDPQQRFVQRTLLLLLAVSSIAAATAGTLHWFEAHTAPINRIVPPLMAVLYAALATWHWRNPDRIVATLWTGWVVGVVGLALPAWYFVVAALGGGSRLVDAFPPVTSVLLPMLLMMVVFAQPRHAAWAVAVAWGLIAAPVVGYLLAHPSELETPRGLDLFMAFGPVSALVPLLIPLLRGVEARYRQLREEGERLQALAERDALIGLYNRRAGERFLATLLANARADAALILFDLDHFKRINDTHGHPAGDAVLIEVGRRCAALLGPDDIFARWGVEEFLVVSPGQSPNGGTALAGRLREAIRSAPIEPVGTVTASFGVTTVQADDTLAQVVQRADDALYRAKAEGRDRVVELR